MCERYGDRESGLVLGDIYLSSEGTRREGPLVSYNTGEGSQAASS